MTVNETLEILEELTKAGLVEKRVLNGVTQWRITEKGRAIKGNSNLVEALERNHTLTRDKQ